MFDDEFKAIIENLPIGAYIYQNDKFIHVNPAYANIFGYSQEEIITGKVTPRDVLLPEDYERFIRELKSRFDDGQAKSHYTLRAKTRDDRNVEIEVEAVLAKFNNIPCAIGSITDVTERNRLARERREMETKLAIGKQKYRSLFQNNPNAVFTFDKNGIILSINSAVVQITGYRKEEIIGLNFKNIINHDDFNRALYSFNEVNVGNLENFELTCMHPISKQTIYLVATIVPIVIEGEITGYFGIASDNTEQKTAKQLISESEQRYRSLFELNANAVYSLDMNGFFTDVNKVVEQLLGYSEQQLLGTHFANLLKEEDLERIVEVFNNNKQGKPENFLVDVIHRDGHLVKLSISTVPIVIGGQVQGVHGISQDVTDHVKAMEQIEKMAYTDALSGLPNRRLFMEKLTERLQQCDYETFSLLYMDIDNFKEINDAYGHEAGDMAITSLASILSNAIGPTDIVSRLGGDEFIVLLEGVSAVTNVIDHVRGELQKPIHIGSSSILLEISIGIAQYPLDGSDPNLLIKRADDAMYVSKKRRKKQVSLC